MNRSAWIRVAAVGGLLAAVLVAWQAGLLDALDRDTLRAWARRAGVLGPVLFVGLFAVGELLHVPSVIFVVVAGLIWPLPLALATAYGGSMLAAATVFLVARWILSGALGEVIRARLPAALRRYDDKLFTQGVRTVALIRLLTFMSPLMHWVLAASRVRFGPMMIGTAIGLAPGISALVIGGDQAMEHWNLVRPYVLAAVGLLVAFRIVQSWRKRRSAEAPEPSEPTDGDDARAVG